MPLSYQTHSVASSASGSGLQFSVGFDFLLKSHVKLYYGYDVLQGTYTSVLADGTDYNWTSTTQVTLSAAPSSTSTLTIIRDTPDSSQQVVWADGSNLIADDMNTADRQNLFVVQEQQDKNDLAATKAIAAETASNTATSNVSTLTASQVNKDGSVAMTGDLDLGSNNIENVADPTAAQHAATKNYVDSNFQPLDAELTELATMGATTASSLADLTAAEVQILDGATVTTAELNILDGVTSTAAELNILDGVTATAAEINVLDGATATTADLNKLNAVTSSAAELNVLDGITSTTAELNFVDGVTSNVQTQLDGKQPLDAELTELATMAATTASALADLTQAEVQILDGATVTTAELNTLDGITATAAELNVLDGSSATTADLNKLSAVSATSAELNTLDGITSTVGELNILDGVTSNASELNVLDGITASTAELNQLDGKTISSTLTPANTNDIPTSSAINSYVSGLLNALGGFVAIADENSFPTTNPDPSDNAGTIVSIANAGGMSISSSGVGTGQTTGGTTVTINGFPSTFNSTTIQDGLGLQVQTTSTLNTYTYHKVYAKDEDVRQLSQDVNDFKARYRVGSSNPTTDLDSGDLFFNTGSGKMLVYNGQNTAWEEVQSIGEFFINTISSSSGTGGGSATFNGSAYRFTLSNAPTNAEQLLVSVNGVVQKPNSGTSQPSEGFAIDGADIIFSSAPATSAPFFIITIGSAVNIGTPSAGTVGTDQLATSAVTNAKVSSTAAIAQSKLDLSITNAEVNASAAIAQSKLDLSITNAEVNASAAIAGTKISPDFGAQDLTVDTNVLHVDATNDRVGVGTASPNTTLNVVGTSDGVVNLDTTDGRGSFIRFAENGTNKVWVGCAEGIITNTDQDDLGLRATDNIVFRPGASESARLDSTGRFLVGRTTTLQSSSERFTVDGGISVLRNSSSNNGTLHIRNEDSTASTNQPYIILTEGSGNRGGIGVVNDSSAMWLSGQAGIRFRGGSSAPGNTEFGRFDSDGLKFNGDTAATNALSDYEEGTHNTTVTMSGDTSFTYHNRTLAYTKIGRMVHVTGRILLSGCGGTSFTFTLPFDNGSGQHFETSNEMQNIRFNDGYTFRISEGTGYANLQSDGSNTGIGVDNPHICVNLTYFTD